jgi:hypothetical protein
MARAARLTNLQLAERLRKAAEHATAPAYATGVHDDYVAELDAAIDEVVARLCPCPPHIATGAVEPRAKPPAGDPRPEPPPHRSR